MAKLKTVMKAPSTPVKAHERMIEFCNDGRQERFPYYTFDGGEHPGKVGLAEWKSHRYTYITGRDNTRGCKILAAHERRMVETLQYLQWSFDQ